MSTGILVGISEGQEHHLLPPMGTRHGLIAGATGTGKTVTLRVLAEGFSKLGVPVFMADVKGDLAGLSQPGTLDTRISERLKKLQIADWAPESFPVVFWDLFGKQGHPLRVTVSEVGPFLLARLLNLNDVQTGVLNVVFKAADENGFLLLDLKDLQAMLTFVGENAKEFTLRYGNISAASIGAIQRNLLALEESGGDTFFGEPALNVDDLLQTDGTGRGVINILAADTLMHSPLVYSTFLLWLLSELFEHLPEAGDLEKPKLVFFFDEAHLLFDEAPKALRDKVEQVVRLIRSKGVGVYFVSQSSLDIADEVLGQLGNRIQHALRAFTARDQRAVRATAETFRSDNASDLESIIGELTIGEALVSLLDKHGAPGFARRAMIIPPRSRLGPISPEERSDVIRTSLVRDAYERTLDRESAYERIKARASATPGPSTEESGAKPPPNGKDSSVGASIFKSVLTGSGRGRQSPLEAFVVSTARSVGSQLGRQIMRGVLGSIMGRGGR